MLFDLSALAPRDCYKLMVSTVVPRPIAWVVTHDAEGRVNAAPYSFFNAVSGDPPTVAISMGNRPQGGLKDSRANIEANRQFVVSLVDEARAEAMNVTAIDFPHGTGELAEAGLETAPSVKVAVPRIALSPVSMECELVQMIPLGQGPNTLVLGRVLAIHIADEAVLDAARCYVDTPKLNLVGRMGGSGGYVRTTDRFEMARIALGDWTARRDR